MSEDSDKKRIISLSVAEMLLVIMFGISVGFCLVHFTHTQNSAYDYQLGYTDAKKDDFDYKSKVEKELDDLENQLANKKPGAFFGSYIMPGGFLSHCVITRSKDPNAGITVEGCQGHGATVMGGNKSVDFEIGR